MGATLQATMLPAGTGWASSAGRAPRSTRTASTCVVRAAHRNGEAARKAAPPGLTAERAAARAAAGPGLVQRLAACAAAAAVALAPFPAAAASFPANAPLPDPGEVQRAVSPSYSAYDFGGKMLFDPTQYMGRWYEVASVKKGFAGEGQADCHCTQGIYEQQQDPEGRIKLQVNTFCVHGGPGGRLSGIQGSVSCANPVVLELLPEFKTEMDSMEGIVAKCALKFDSLPFIPAEPYIVLRTDYTSYALVRGAQDRSFVQVYSRTPNPGPQFIAEQKAVLAELGYPIEEIVDTPQDCPEMAPSAMMARMNAGMSGAQLMPGSTPAAKAMRGYDLGPAVAVLDGTADNGVPDSLAKEGIAFERLRNPLETLRNALTLFGN